MKIRKKKFDSLDLHYIPPNIVIPVVMEFLQNSLEKKYEHVKIITGKGIGAIRHQVAVMCSELSYVDRITIAQPWESGAGALYIYFKKEVKFMKVPFYTPTREYANKKVQFNEAITEVLENGNFILGNQVEELEQMICDFTGAKYAVGCASGSDALLLGADILGFNDGKEVITTPFTFLASVSCIARNRGKPVFVDIDEESCGINPHQIESKISKNTVGLLPVHLFNSMSDMNEVKNIGDRNNLKILEDAAEAFGMRYNINGEMIHSGLIGDMGVFSFFPTKTLGGYGDGGMIITNDEEIYKLARSLRVHGASKKYYYDYIGYNSRLDTLQASILKVKMEYIGDSISKREKIARYYSESLKNIGGIRLFPKASNQQQVYYVYNILSEKRDQLVRYLSENGIGTSIYYPVPLHLQKCFSYLGYKKGDFPVSEKIADQILALPIFPELSDDEVSYVVETIKKFNN